MKAAIIHAARDLRVEEATLPPVGPRDVMVRVRAGGICGSDLHYYQHGGFGTVRLREPMILGHEIAGEVVEAGAEVTRVRAGDVVAVDPSRPCGHCRYCLEGMPRHCLDMLFYGSAMRFPHVQGGFRERLVCTEAQAVRVPAGLTVEKAAFAEPLAVCLHAGKQAGPLLGKRVLITGCGPIGALMVVVARFGGAAEVVVTDIADAPLAVARKLGASLTANTATEAAALDPYRAGKGVFDVLFEASGNQAALRSALDLLRPGAIIVQVGLGGEMTLPINTIVAKELQLRGTFRFDPEFELALRLMGEGLIDVKPLITASLPFASAVDAFELASDRSKSMKVQLTF